MKQRFRTSIAGLAVGIAAFACASLSVAETARGAVRRAILDALRVPVQEALQQPVEFVVERIETNGAWAFVIATPQSPGGRAIAWQRTICSGDVSHLVGGLLRLESGRWVVRDLAVCPTDVAWADWATRHGAPPALFR